MSSHFRFTTEGYVYSDYIARCPEYINNDWKFANGNKGWENGGRQFNFYCSVYETVSILLHVFGLLMGPFITQPRKCIAII